jgi:hypothetical protein
MTTPSTASSPIDYAISASVLDKGSMVERYALRQIERAREEAIDPMLRS